jgi:hypothetical protein
MEKHGKIVCAEAPIDVREFMNTSEVQRGAFASIYEVFTELNMLSFDFFVSLPCKARK